MKNKELIKTVYSPVCRLCGWEINKLENKKLGYKKYFAYFLDSPKDKPITLNLNNLKKLKSLIIGINLKKGGSYVS